MPAGSKERAQRAARMRGPGQQLCETKRVRELPVFVEDAQGLEAYQQREKYDQKKGKNRLLIWCERSGLWLTKRTYLKN